ncbi:MutL [Salmonella phage 39]|nr:MutL [Salmonella phage 39]
MVEEVYLMTGFLFGRPVRDNKVVTCEVDFSCRSEYSSYAPDSLCG